MTANISKLKEWACGFAAARRDVVGSIKSPAATTARLDGFLAVRERVRQEGPGEAVVFVPWLNWIQDQRTTVH